MSCLTSALPTQEIHPGSAWAEFRNRTTIGCNCHLRASTHFCMFFAVLRSLRAQHWKRCPAYRPLTRTLCFRSAFACFPSAFALLSLCFRSAFALFSLCFPSAFALLSLCFRSVFALLSLCFRFAHADCLCLFLHTGCILYVPSMIANMYWVR